MLLKIIHASILDSGEGVSEGYGSLLKEKAAALKGKLRPAQKPFALPPKPARAPNPKTLKKTEPQKP